MVLWGKSDIPYVCSSFFNLFASIEVNYSCQTVYCTSCEFQEHIRQTAVLPSSGGAALKDSTSLSSLLYCKPGLLTLGGLDTINKRKCHVVKFGMGMSRCYSEEPWPLEAAPGVCSWARSVFH